jgi:hypothetical protein
VSARHAEPAEHDEQREHRELRDQERRLLLRRRERVEESDFHERLRHADEAVEPARGGCRDDIDPAPRTGEAKQIERCDREREQHEGNDADDPRRIEAERRQRESSRAREHQRAEEDRGERAR